MTPLIVVSKHFLEKLWHQKNIYQNRNCILLFVKNLKMLRKWVCTFNEVLYISVIEKDADGNYYTFGKSS